MSKTTKYQWIRITLLPSDKTVWRRASMGAGAKSSGSNGCKNRSVARKEMSQHDSTFWGLTTAKYYAWRRPNLERQLEGWPDPTLFPLNELKSECKTSQDSNFLMFIIFAYVLKMWKIPNCKQQFTAAICVNKGCPHYSRWEDSSLQKLIKMFKSNSPYHTAAVRDRHSFLCVSCWSCRTKRPQLYNQCAWNSSIVSFMSFSVFSLL